MEFEIHQYRLTIYLSNSFNRPAIQPLIHLKPFKQPGWPSKRYFTTFIPKYF
jgi:hypothetical protein